MPNYQYGPVVAMGSRQSAADFDTIVGSMGGAQPSGTPTPTPSPAPTALTSPTNAGTPQSGQTLTGVRGTYTGSPTSYADQWQASSDGGTNWSNIAGATALNYTLTNSEVGKVVRRGETATNANGSAPVNYSAATTTVLSAALTTVTAFTLADVPNGTYYARYDPANAAARTVDGNGFITALADQSGNNRGLTGSTGTAPSYATNTATGSALFDGSDDVLTSSASFNLPQPFTVIYALYKAADLPAFQTAYDFNNSGTQTVIGRHRQGSTALMLAGSTFLPPTLPIGVQFLVTERYAGGTGTRSYTGEDGTTGETSGAVGANAAVGNLRLGNSMNADAPGAHYQADILFMPGSYNPADTDALTRKIYARLHWKNRLQERQAAGNPYRYAPPTSLGPQTPPTWNRQSTTMIPHQPVAGNGPYATNIFDACVLDDPEVTDGLVMFTSAQTTPRGSGMTTILRWTAVKSAPYAWTYGGVVFDRGSSGGWDFGDFGVRLGKVIRLSDGSLAMAYCSQYGAGGNAIGIATSTAASNGRVWTRPASPIITATGNGRNDGLSVGEPDLIQMGDGTFSITYSYRTAENASGRLLGYRGATSSTLLSGWTKVNCTNGNADLIKQPSAAMYMEKHQKLFRNGRWHMIFEMGGAVEVGITYRNYIAVGGANIFDPYVHSNLLNAEDLTKEYHTATPHIFSIGSTDYLFVTSALIESGNAAQPYYNNAWSMLGGTITGWTI